MKFRFLGTGTSVGVPQIGCTCRVCTSPDPRDRRRRCGAYVTASDGAALLVDTPPELRLACLEYGISKVDAVALTHAHMDHVAAFDDVRRFNTINGEKVPCEPGDPLYRGLPYRIIGKPLVCHAMGETIGQMHRIFPYIGMEGGKNGLYRPMVEFSDAASFSVGSMAVERLKVEHGFPCCGYLFREWGTGNGEWGTGNGERGTGNGERVTGNGERGTGNGERGMYPPSEASAEGTGRGASPRRPQGERAIAYISDCHELPEETIERVKGVDVMVLNCLRERQHPTHLSLERALGYLGQIAPKKAYLVHMCHDLTHEDWLARLAGTNVEPAYDGLELKV